MSSNYPPGVTDAHPYFNPPPEQRCRECGEDVFPGQECEHCGEYCLSDDEMREEAEYAKADAMRDMMVEEDWDREEDW